MARNYHLRLKGYVGGYDFDENYVSYVLDKNRGKPVDVLIDSLGGSVKTALSIVRAFKDHGDVTVYLAGMNASAATIVSMGAKRIFIDKNAMYLVHKVSSFFFQIGSMNADQISTHIKKLSAEQRNLEKFDMNIATMYAERCRRSKEDLLALMKQGGWLTAQEAIDWGFVDAIEENAEANKPEMTDSLAASMMASGIPIPQSMQKKSIKAALSEALSSFFGFSETKNNLSMDKIFKKIGEILQAEVSAPEGGTAILTAEQLQMLENSLNEREQTVERLTARNQELEAEISALRKEPGDTTAAITDPGNKTERTELEEYRRNLLAAQELYDIV